MSWEYELRESRRAKRVRISVFPNGRVVVTKPLGGSAREVERFMRSQATWIEASVAKVQKRLERQKKKGIVPIELSHPRRGSKAYKQAVKDARVLARERLEHFNQIYGFTYGSISVRNQKTRWGSCSQKNNLSFNYRIVFLPLELADYIIVHELCHTAEHNHSTRFWSLVAKTFPHYDTLRKKLKKYKL